MGNKQISVLVFMWLAVSSSIFSHGVKIGELSGGVGVKVMYDSKNPISGANVTVYSPLDQKNSFYSGITDKNGCFMFLPNSDGKWKVVIVDKTGHGGIKCIDVENSKLNKVMVENESVGSKILSGVGILFGISGLLFFILAIKERKKSVNAHS